MVTAALMGVFALVALVWFGVSVSLVRRFPPVGIGLSALVILPLWEAPTPPALITLAGFNITIADVVTLILFVVGLLEFAQLRENLQGWLIPWLFLGVWIALSLLRGIAIFGLGTATNEARGVLWVYFAMTWALAVRADRLKLHSVSLVLGWMLVLVAVYHSVVYGIGDASSITYGPDGLPRTNRILVSGQSVALLLCAGIVFMGGARSSKGRRRFVGSSLVFLGVIVVSQHRSVWIAGLVGLTAVIIFATGASASGRSRSRAVALLVAGGWLALVGWTLVGSANDVISSAVDAGTLDWRASGWQALISDAIARGPVTIAIGEPFGSGFVRTVNAGYSTGVQPHNWYVEIFLRLGVVGLAALVGILLAAISKSRATSSEWMFSLGVVAAYAAAYAVDWFLAPWLAAAVVMSLRARNDVHVASKSQPPDGIARRVGATHEPRSSWP